jgi:hypothetical protein
MVAGSCLVALTALLAAAPQAAPVPKRSLLLATAVEPLRVDRLADALRTYLDGNRIEVRTAPAVASGDLRADLAATVQAGAGEDATTVLRIAPTTAEDIEIALSDLPSERTVIASIPRSIRDEDLYRTLALKVQGLLRAIEEQPAAPVPPADASETVAAASGRIDLQAGLTVLTFPLGDVIQEGALLRGHWALAETVRLGLGLRVLPAVQRKAGATDVRMRAVPLVASVERLWRGPRFEFATGLLVLSEVRHAEATAGQSRQGDWSFVLGGGVSFSFAIRLGRAVRLSLQAAAIGLPWSDRYRVGETTVLDATRLEIPVDLTLDVLM